MASGPVSRWGSWDVWGVKSTTDMYLRRVPADLWLQVRKTCRERGISAREFVIEAIRKAVREHR